MMMKLETIDTPRLGRSLTTLALAGSLGFVLTACGGGGGAAPAPRFALVQTCVSDAVTGLTWQKLPGLTQTYTDLAAYVAAENTAKTCGITDWRLPSVNELLSLVDSSVTAGNAPNADASVSGDRMTTKFWTQETRAGSTTDAWQVDMATGATVDFAIKTGSLSVRLVRGAATTPTACDNADGRFSASVAGSVTDRVAKLMWKQCPEGYTDSACTAGTPLSFTDQAAINARVSANNTPLAPMGLGFSDWRVPTKNELASLVNRSCTNPVLISSVFPNIGVLNFVSATVDADAPTTRVWSVNFTDGSIGPVALDGPFSLRLVRNSL